MSLIPLFASPIYSQSLLSARSALLQEIQDEAYLIRRGDRAGQEWSKSNYQRGYTSYSSLDQLQRFSSTFQSLEKKIDPCVEAYIKGLGLQVNPKEIRLTRMWLNIMGEGCSHPMHLHPLSVVSGTFYVQTPPHSAAIRFEDPRLDSFMARPLAKSLVKSQASALHYSLKPKRGDLVLFESWLRHEVPPHQSKIERISVSFNYDWVGI